MASYYIEPHSADYPIKTGNGKTSFYVTFTASDSSTVGPHYYEVDSEDPTTVKEVLEKVASDYESTCLSKSSVVEGEIAEVKSGEAVDVVAAAAEEVV